MGRVDVVLARRPGGFTRVCVLKRMLIDVRSPDLEARFRREADIALRLSHGAIVQTLDVVEVDGELCLLQELVHGTTMAHLEHRIAGANESVPVPVALHIGSEVARALAYVHSFEGGAVIHRDVTPDNIMLSFSGETKLIDFGIAKSQVEQPLTEVGLVVGRPLYTAPEVLAGQPVSARSDIYSLGVVLWQVLAGRAFPKGAASLPPPSSTNPAVSVDLDKVVLTAVATRPEERYPSAADLQAELVALLPRVPPPDRALAAFLARHFNVDKERRQMTEDIEKATTLLASDTSSSAFPDQPPLDSGLVPVRVSPQGPRRRWSRSLLRAAAGIAVLAVVAALLVSRPWARKPPPSRDSNGPIPQSSPASKTLGPIAEPATAESAPTTRAMPLADAQPPVHTYRARRPGRSTADPVAERDNTALLRDAERKFKSGDLVNALDLARRALREGAGGEGHIVMGKILYARNQLSEAEAEFENAVRASPSDAEASRYLDLVRQDLRAEHR